MSVKRFQWRPVHGLVLAALVVSVAGGVMAYKAARDAPMYKMMADCRQEVLKKLKSPGSAVFEASPKMPLDTEAQKKPVMLWLSYVDSQNSLGALLRTSFSCIYPSSSGETYAALLD